MTKQEPKKLPNGMWGLENVIDTRTGLRHSVVQLKHKKDVQYFEDAEA